MSMAEKSWMSIHAGPLLSAILHLWALLMQRLMPSLSRIFTFMRDTCIGVTMAGSSGFLVPFAVRPNDVNILKTLSRRRTGDALPPGNEMNGTNSRAARTMMSRSRMCHGFPAYWTRESDKYSIVKYSAMNMAMMK